MYGIKFVRLRDNIKTVLSRRASANRFPLGFRRRAKHLGVVGLRTVKEYSEHCEANGCYQTQSDYFPDIAFQGAYYHVFFFSNNNGWRAIVGTPYRAVCVYLLMSHRAPISKTHRSRTQELFILQRLTPALGSAHIIGSFFITVFS